MTSPATCECGQLVPKHARYCPACGVDGDSARRPFSLSALLGLGAWLLVTGVLVLAVSAAEVRAAKRSDQQPNDSAASDVPSGGDRGTDASSSTNQVERHGLEQEGSPAVGQLSLVAEHASSVGGKRSAHALEKALDGDPSTWWMEGKKGDGIGVKVRFGLPTDAVVHSVRLLHGYDKVRDDKWGDRWPLNNRLRSVSVKFSSGRSLSADLEDHRDWQTIEVSPPESSRWFEVKILSVYPGKDSAGKRVRDSGIAEIQALGVATTAAPDAPKSRKSRAAADFARPEETLAHISNSTTAPRDAVALGKAALSSSSMSRRDVARALNSRGHRLYEAGDLDDSIILTTAAAKIDPRYGMPRYNSARSYASKGDVTSCVEYLQQLKAMGRGQRKRLNQARRDEGFSRVWGTPAFKAVFR